jgi:hypothetical protein
MIYRLATALSFLGLAYIASAMPVIAVTTGDRWAVVAADWTKVRGDGVVSTKEYSRAVLYEVIFNRNVAGCAFTAMVGSSDETFPDPGYALLAPRAGNPKGVAVATKDASGLPAARDWLTSLPAGTHIEQSLNVSRLYPRTDCFRQVSAEAEVPSGASGLEP